MASDTTDQRKIAGTIPIPEDRRRLLINALWFLILLAYLPGSYVVQQLVSTYELGPIMGWPGFHLWIIFVGPTLVFVLYLYDAYYRIGLDVQFEETVDLEQTENRGN